MIIVGYLSPEFGQAGSILDTQANKSSSWVIHSVRTVLQTVLQTVHTVSYTTSSCARQPNPVDLKKPNLFRWRIEFLVETSRDCSTGKLLFEFRMLNLPAKSTRRISDQGSAIGALRDSACECIRNSAPNFATNLATERTAEYKIVSRTCYVVQGMLGILAISPFDLDGSYARRQSGRLVKAIIYTS